MTSELPPQVLLRKLPAVERILEQAARDRRLDALPRSVVLEAVRTVIDGLRRRILAQAVPPAEEMTDAAVLEQVAARAAGLTRRNLVPLINASGVVIHTNLGRSLLAEEALENLRRIAGRYSNLEYNLAEGHRGSRYSAVEALLCEISGAEAAMAVNNNAAAVLLCLETLARDREVIVSRGELVEIGGSFRIPDIMARSGGKLREVGTTNRTHLRDYQEAIGPQTALLLKVHTSNYRVVGFTAAVPLAELVALGRQHGLPVMEDLGSGTFVDLSRFGLIKEPTVQESVAAGADAVTFSGDKLLGGPQAGLIVGRREIVGRIQRNPLTRALRIDKLTLAALEETLRLYRNGERAVESIPTLRLLTMPVSLIRTRAEALRNLLVAAGGARVEIALLERPSRAGGGSLPLLELPSVCLAVRVAGLSVNTLERSLRLGEPAIIGRIEADLFLMDPRTIMDDEYSSIVAAFHRLFSEIPA